MPRKNKVAAGKSSARADPNQFLTAFSPNVWSLAQERLKLGQERVERNELALQAEG